MVSSAATLLACGLATLLVYVGHFYDKIESGMSIYLQLLVCFSIPWVVIVVYGHVKRRGYYDVDDLQVFNRRLRGGIYWYKGGLNPSALTLWCVAALAGMLFSVNDAYTGLLAPVIGGMDGGLIASGLVALIGCPIIYQLWPDGPEVYAPEPLPAQSSAEAPPAVALEHS